MKMKQGYRKFLLLLLTLGMAALFGYSIYYIKYCIPDCIYLHTGKVNQVNLHMPVKTCVTCSGEEYFLWSENGLEQEVSLNPNEAFLLQSESSKHTSLDLSIFGKWKLKTIDLQFQDDSYVLPSGKPCGIYLKMDGIFVLGTEELMDINGTVLSPCQGILQPEDYIVAVNGIPIESKEELIELVQASQCNCMTLKVRRQEEYIEVSVTPVETAPEKYQIGAWVKDDLQGIGTITYIRSDGSYAALGHGISETATGSVVSIKEGALFQCKIKTILKGSVGNPGSFSGIICYGDAYYMGSVCKNQQNGIFGTLGLLDPYYQKVKPVPIGYKQEVKEGKASIICTLEEEPEEFEIEIVNVHPNNSDSNKSLVIKVTDERLLEKTGGIVQGMSGSPILQDGKLIGAVTHVFVNDPTKGYGIFIEDMLE